MNIIVCEKIKLAVTITTLLSAMETIASIDYIKVLLLGVPDEDIEQIASMVRAFEDDEALEILSAMFKEKLDEFKSLG